jgi:hypothetical protein
MCAVKYDERATIGSLNDIPEHDVCGVALKDDMVDLYVAKFVPEDQPGRSTYAAIRQSAYRGRCALCSQLPATTVDHYLPKSKFPAFAVFPRNMVPACKQCNDAKFTSSNGLTLHPYYDDIATIRWLRCELIDGEKVSVIYTVWADVQPAELRQRMTNHLTDVGVGELYQSSALVDLSNIRHRLVSLGQSGGAQAVRAHLEEELASRLKCCLNSWSTALYRAMVETTWFVRDKGYARIEVA